MQRKLSRFEPARRETQLLLVGVQRERFSTGAVSAVCTVIEANVITQKILTGNVFKHTEMHLLRTPSQHLSDNTERHYV